MAKTTPLHQGYRGGFKAGLEAMLQTSPSRYAETKRTAPIPDTYTPPTTTVPVGDTTPAPTTTATTTKQSPPGPTQTTRKISANDPEFKQIIKDAGITFKETPGAFLGAYTARVLGDIVNQETRAMWWEINHPIALVDKLAAKAIDPNKQLHPYQRAGILASFVTPAFALAGAYDPTNISELGRPKGYKQNNPDPDDPTQSLDPATEVFERFMLGRQGRPLAYEKAKEEIPTLTKQRYANYMNFMYNEPALLGSVKATSENLQGVPEARVFGYPVSIPTVTAVAGGIAGARLGMASAPKPPAAVQLNLLEKAATPIESSYKPRGLATRGMLGGLAGGAAGAIAGVLANQALAARANQSQLPMQ